MFTRRFLLAGAGCAALGSGFGSSSAYSARRRRATGRAAVRPAATESYTATTPLGPYGVAAKWAFVMNYTTGATLLEKDADARMAPSSLTKLMTIYIVFGLLKQGKIALDQAFLVSERAWRTGGSKMFVPLGGHVKIQDLIQGVVVVSGNDACVVLAEGIAGSETQFVNMMNETAQRMGLSNSHFMNCDGMPDDNHYMSARDIATLASHLIRDYPEYYHFFSEKEFSFNNITQGNRNTLVGKGLADGLKTGHTSAGGFGLCASAERNGNRVILVLNGMKSMRVRAQEGERLMNWAFSSFENITICKKGEALDEAPVWLGASATVPLVAQHDVILTLPHGWQKKARVTLDYEAPIAAPVKEGQPVAAQLSLSGVGSTPLNVALVAGRDVPRANIFSRSASMLKYRITGH